MLTPRLLSAASRAPQVGFWLALLPLSVYSVDISWNHLVTIPCCMAITFFLLGIEELGLQIEEPFSILPMEAFCDASIGNVLNAMVLQEDKARAMEQASAPILEQAEPAPTLKEKLFKAAPAKAAPAEVAEPAPAEVAEPAKEPSWKKAWAKAAGVAL